MREYHKWTRAEDELLIALYERRLPQKKIAERIGLPTTTIQSRIALLRTQMGLPNTYLRRGVTYHNWTTADLTEVAALRKSGKLIREIAEEFGVSETSLNSVLVKLRKEGRL